MSPHKLYLLALLTLNLAFNLSDRLALGLMLQNIKRDLGLTDVQLGLVSGLAFAILYALMGIPIARWADRGDRVTIISLCAALWGLMVMASGLATSFLQLLIIRLVSGIADAGCQPASFSLIADSFSRGERPRVSAIYTLGAPLSFIFGYLPAGWLNDSYGWRVTFMVLGLPALVVAGLTKLTLRDPRFQRDHSNTCDVERTNSTELPVAQEMSVPQVLTFTEVCGYLWKIPTFRHLLLGYSVMYFVISGVLQWLPTFLFRSYEMSAGVVGTYFSLVFGIGGLLGTLLGGELVALYAARNEGLQLRAVAIAYVVLGIISSTMFISVSKVASLSELTAFAVCMYATSSPLWATIQTVVPASMRATSIAIIYLSANLLGAGLGPVAIGVLSDTLAPLTATESLRYALLAITPGFLWCAWHFWRSSVTAIHDINTGKACQAQSGQTDGLSIEL